jgi:hypothetical protein
MRRTENYANLRMAESISNELPVAGIPFLTPRIHIHIYLSPERTGDSLIELIRYWILWKWQCHSAGTLLGSSLTKVPRCELGCQNSSMNLKN